MKQHKAPPPVKLRGLRFRWVNLWQPAIIVVLFSLGAFLGLRELQAAGFVIDKEVESVQPIGNASIVDDGTASGGKATRFGFNAPSNLVARTGGNSIALLWDLPADSTGSTEIFRNGTKIGTVIPGNGVVHGDKLGTRYIDRAVTRGTTYQYQVRSVSSSGQATALSPAINVTHPTNTTPVPTITIDAAQATDLTDYLNNQAKPEIETWYSKISDTLAYPSYTPLNSMRLFMDASYTGVASADYTTRTIRVNPAWLRANLEDGGGMFLHEATHILQAYPSDTTGWATEGIADWVRDYYTRERYQLHVPKPNAKLTNGYAESAYMLQWAETKYSVGLIRKLNIALHNGTYTNSFVPNLTGGRTPEQLYAEAQAAHLGAKGLFKLLNNCMDLKDSSTVSGTDLRILTCAGSSTAQQWTLLYTDAGLNGTTKNKFAIVNYGVDPAGRCALAYNTSSRVASVPCQSPLDKRDKWSRGSGNSLINLDTGKCLASTNNSPTSGSLLVTTPCDGSAAQSWTLP